MEIGKLTIQDDSEEILNSLSLRDADMEVDENSDVEMTPAEYSFQEEGNSSFMENISHVLSSAKKLSTPTAIGAKLALVPYKKRADTSVLVEEPEEQVSSYSTSYGPETSTPVKGFGSTVPFTPRPWENSAPVSYQMHHHHYYTPQHPQMMQQPGQMVQQGGQVVLPQPWQSNIIPQERVPYLLSSYLQLIVNAIVTFYSCGLIYKCISTVKADINAKMEEHIHELIVEGTICRRSYFENGCEPDKIVPALETQCGIWEKCMNRDPYSSGSHSSVSAETLGVIINSLVEPIGFKSFLFLAGIMGILFLFNVSFGFFRAKTYYGWDATADEQPQPQTASPLVSQTPGYWSTQRFDRGGPIISPSKRPR